MEMDTKRKRDERNPEAAGGESWEGEADPETAEDEAAANAESGTSKKAGTAGGGTAAGKDFPGTEKAFVDQASGSEGRDAAGEGDQNEDDEDEEPEPKKKFFQIIAAALLLGAACLLDRKAELRMWGRLLLYLPPYLAAGFDVLKEAAEHIGRGEVFDEDFLMSLATAGALLIGFVPGGEPMFAEAVFVMLFFQVGELLEGVAEGRSRRSIAELMDMRPDTANVERDGTVREVSPEEVGVGEIIIIRPGEKVPADGIILEGSSAVDTLALTGESEPRDVSAGDKVLSGFVNRNGLLRVRTEKPAGESTAAKVLEMVEHAAARKSKSEKFITRFAKIYTPVVVCAAVLLAFLPPLFSGNFSESFAPWLLRALTFLVVSCPCALVISVPLTFFAGIGAASRQGILIKGSSYVDALARTETVVFDKTGTLTKGVFEVTDLHPETIPPEELLHLAAHVERYSTHPIAASLKAAFAGESDGCRVEKAEELAGLGVRAVVEDRTIYAGNSRLMDRIGAKWRPCEDHGTIIHIAENDEYLGHIHISDVEKPDAKQTVEALKEAGAGRIVMLTGDRKKTAEKVARDLGIAEVEAELLPGDKVDRVEALMRHKTAGRTLLFVGDGITDAPVLARADVGAAMGALGSDAAIEAADVVLMDDKPSKLAAALGIAKKTVSVAGQNITFAIAVKAAILILAAFGLAPMWLAVFGDTGVMLICVLNAMRAGRR